ncbi:MAG: DEAD/DEAH box helicase family protein [Mycoplasma sp.]|nr:DEAD/DEAH box helicase family protein [Mycoplasma sp.]
MLRRKGRVILGDDPGLGKTAQSISFLVRAVDSFPALIVCPASVKYNWKKEIEKWTSIKDVQVIDGSGKKIKKNPKITIMNYDILKKYEMDIIDRFYNTIVLDESHKIKSKDAIRTQVITNISQGVPYILALSGTPIENRPIEIFSILHILQPKKYNDRNSFALKYCDAKKGRFGWDVSGASNLEELHEKIKKVLIRRRKTDVLKDLPEKIRTTYYIDVSKKEKKKYLQLENSFIEVTSEKRKIKHYLLAYNQFAKEIWELKRQAVFEYIENHCIDQDKKLIVFAHNTIVINEIYERFKRITVFVDGSVKDEKRQKAVDSFQESEKVKLFIGQNIAAGEGITLTAASHLAIIQLPQKPSLLLQIEDRAHRYGQKNCVNIIYFFLEDSVEELFLQMLIKKEKIKNKSIDGDFEEEHTAFIELLSNIKKKGWKDGWWDFRNKSRQRKRGRIL